MHLDSPTGAGAGIPAVYQKYEAIGNPDPDLRICPMVHTVAFLVCFGFVFSKRTSILRTLPFFLVLLSSYSSISHPGLGLFNFSLNFINKGQILEPQRDRGSPHNVALFRPFI